MCGTIANKPKTLKNLMSVIYNSIDSKLINPSFVGSKEINTYDIEADEDRVSGIVSRAEEIAKKVCTYSDSRYNSKTRKIDKILTSKKFGIPIMIAFLALIFWITITGANYPSSLLSDFFAFIQNKLLILFAFMNVPAFLTNILIYRNVPNCDLGYSCNASTYGDFLSIIYFA